MKPEKVIRLKVFSLLRKEKKKFTRAWFAKTPYSCKNAVDSGLKNKNLVGCTLYKCLCYPTLARMCEDHITKNTKEQMELVWKSMISNEAGLLLLRKRNPELASLLWVLRDDKKLSWWKRILGF